jgi:hypothetical protein
VYSRVDGWMYVYVQDGGIHMIEDSIHVVVFCTSEYSRWWCQHISIKMDLDLLLLFSVLSLLSGVQRKMDQH